jgi:hypothetical protein
MSRCRTLRVAKLGIKVAIGIPIAIAWLPVLAVLYCQMFTNLATQHREAPVDPGVGRKDQGRPHDAQ